MRTRLKERLMIIQSKIEIYWRKQSRNLSHIFLIMIFCNMTERPTDKVNYILDAHWYREKKSAVNLA